MLNTRVSARYGLGKERVTERKKVVIGNTGLFFACGVPTLADSIAFLHARGLATARGAILDVKNGLLNNAVLSLASAGTSVRTNGRGQFVLGLLPAGTHRLKIRRLGYAKRTHSVRRRANEVTEVSLAIAGLNTLSTYTTGAYRLLLNIPGLRTLWPHDFR